MESSADTLRVYLRGQLVYETLGSTERCWEAVRAAFKPSVVLDLSAVTFIASAALGSLLGLRRWLESRGSRLRVSAVSPEVRRVLTATGLHRFFAIDDEAHETAA
jgi:anti-anti-sigma factor